MRRTTLFLTIALCPLYVCNLQAQQRIVDQINMSGLLDEWSVRCIEESDIIGGNTKYLYEFYGHASDTTFSREPLQKPADYHWRTNNVLANVMGVIKTNCTVFPERRGDGWCARIETHIETVKALGINMDVVCQGALLIGDIEEPIRNTKDPMSKVLYGIPFSGRPEALVYDYKADVGHSTIRGTGFSKLKDMGYPDYPEISVFLQKRWEDEKGNVHALRVGTACEILRKNVTDWVNGYRMEIRYGDITSDPDFEPYMDLNNDPDRAFHAINSRGDNVQVIEDGWAEPGTEPNFLIIKFIASSGQAFYGGVGNTLWIDNVHLEM